MEDGGSAFPMQSSFATGGMSLWDYYAGEALSGYFADPVSSVVSPENIAIGCFNQADAMIKERQKRMEKNGKGIKDLEHFKNTVLGLWATDKPELISDSDKKKYSMFEIKE